MFFSKVLSLVVAATAATAVTVSFDSGYDDARRSLSSVSCSDGPNGLMRQFSTQGAIPNFPNIGGAAAVGGWNSPNCGSCWQLTYQGTSINVLAIDHTDVGFNIAQTAMNTLTNGQAQFLGRIDATAVQVDRSNCGL